MKKTTTPVIRLNFVSAEQQSQVMKTIFSFAFVVILILGGVGFFLSGSACVVLTRAWLGISVIMVSWGARFVPAATGRFQSISGASDWLSSG